MMIAHLPAGYLYGYLCYKYGGQNHLGKKGIYGACCLGAIFPDLDMFYFYLLDNRQTHHHEYWTHLPCVWLVAGIIVFICRFIFSDNKKTILGVLFIGGGFIHLMLDSLVGDVWWLYPFIDKPYALFTVPARYSPWWLNFILHWSFLAEVLILFCSLALFAKKSKYCLTDDYIHCDKRGWN